MNTTGRRRRAVFFDVDGTLTRTTTMFDLLHFDAARHGRSADAAAFIDELRRMQSEDSAPRSAANRRYFSWWAGRTVADVTALVTRWIGTLPPDYFHRSSITKLREHRREGDAIVLVSGSLPALLAELAHVIGADHVLATTMASEQGVFSGEIDEPMIGERKTEAVRQLAAGSRWDLAEAFAYGDHASDVPFLELVGNPVICGTVGTPEWTIATQRGWDRLPLDA